jgi:S1-C subfamily serine protease
MTLKSILLPSFVVIALGCGSSSSSPAVSAIAVTPSPCAVGRTDSVQMTATATLPNGTTENITSDAAWSTTNSQTATVNATGVVVGVNAGVTSITAAYEGATGSIDCTVGP